MLKVESGDAMGFAHYQEHEGAAQRRFSELQTIRVVREEHMKVR